MAALVLLTVLLKGCMAAESLRFLAVGDWGGIATYPYDTPFQTAVARQMAYITKTFGSSFNLAVGDNFYNRGVKNVDDKRFTYTFENVYHYNSLMNPWYILAGNHDHRGNVSAQIAYSKKSKRWKFPDYYYNLSFQVPGGKKLDIVMLDTVLLCGNTGSDEMNDQPISPDDVGAAEDQWVWLEKQLQTSTADYLLVAGHFPVYSAGGHGPTQCLTERLKPMLYRYNVTAYICGHDHNLQHISSEEGGKTVDYIVSGAGHFSDELKLHTGDIPKGSLKFFWGKWKGLGGFAYFEASSKQLTMNFISGLNQTLYSHTMSPRH